MAQSRPPRESLAEFFGLRSSTGYRKGGRGRSFGSLSAEEVHRLLRTMSGDLEVVDDLVKFVKGHRRIARELTLEDVRAAMDEQAVREVMKS